MAIAFTSKPQTKKATPVKRRAKPTPVPKPPIFERTPGFGFRFPQGAIAPTIQPKLKIGEPNDKYEQEADRVADIVMRMTDNAVTTNTPSITLSTLQRMEMEDEEDTLQTKQDSGGIPAVTPGIQSGINRLRQGGGVTLPASTRTFMEPRFGHDFTNVKIHTSPQAANLSRSVNARAFTVGHDIFFNQGEFQLTTNSGMQLLAHELTHTIQQTSNSTRLQRDEDPGSSSIEGKGTLKLKGCEGKEAKLNEILNLSRKFADAGVACLELGDSLNFQQWFGQYTPARHQRILRRMKRLRNWLFNHSIKFICVPPEKVKESKVPGFPVCRTYVKDGKKQHTVAHTKGVIFTPVWLCPPFFEEPLHNQASTLLHEAAHAAFSALDRGESQKLVGGLNAYNFEGFARQALMGCSPAEASEHRKGMNDRSGV